MEVDTNELLHRIGAVLRGISDKLDRLVELASDHFADANKMVVEKPPKKWRILEPEEVVQDGDWMNARVNSQEDGPPDGGWVAASSFYFGKEASVSSGLYFARTVSDEPAKEPEPEHPAGPKPDPGEGYRILSKDPPEDLQEGDEHELSKGEWVESVNARTDRVQGPSIWYRRKVEVAKQPKPEYREPVLPADAGKVCEFSDDGETWQTGTLFGFSSDVEKAPWESGNCLWEHARIKKDA